MILTLIVKKKVGIIMFKKIGKFLRKLHRFLTPLFVLVTVTNMFVFQHPVIRLIQQVLMLAMAASGLYLYVQIYCNKYKAKKRREIKKCNN
jgi:hypothetical protein